MPASMGWQTRENRRFYGELESLRGLAALSVVFYHFAISTLPRIGNSENWLAFASQSGTHAFAYAVQAVFNGQAAVMLFFVLSGFVLGVNIETRDRLDVRGYSAFLVRRFFRLVVPLWVAIIATILTYHLLFARASSLHQIIDFLLLRDVSINGALWSLAPEILTSIAFPIALLLVPRLSIGLQVIGTFLIFTYQLHSAFRFNWYGWNVNSFAHCFYLGMIVPTVGRAMIERLGGLATALAPVALIAYAVTNYTMPYYPFATPLYTATPFGAFYIISWLLYGNATGVVSVLNRGPPRFLGRISYSLYILHLPIIALLLRFVPSGTPEMRFLVLVMIATPPCLFVAWLSYRLVELPSTVIGRSIARRITSSQPDSHAPAPATRLQAVTAESDPPRR